MPQILSYAYLFIGESNDSVSFEKSRENVNHHTKNLISNRSSIMMPNDDLLYIEDDNKRRLYYRFTPAALISNFIPLIVILDDKNTDHPMHFEHKMWNVLTPLYHSESKNIDTYWLGEKEDFFVKDLLQKLIQQIAEEYECEDHIYLYGSNISGYGAILHGILCKANAVYAYEPHIRLQEPNITLKSKENDLTRFLNSTDRFPIFYLGTDEAVHTDQPEDETAYFMDACKKHHIKVHLKVSSISEGDETKKLTEVLDFFERVASER